MLLSNWNLLRFVRLGLGIMLAVQAYQFHDLFPGVLGGLVLFQAITNTGCCGANGCAIPIQKANDKKTEEPAFEEIKPAK